MNIDRRLIRLLSGTAGTLACVALLLSLKTGGQTTQAVAATGSGDTTGALPAPGTPPGGEVNLKPAKPPIQRTVTGQDVLTRRNHGPLRVRITVAEGRITAVSGTQDATSPKSKAISDPAIAKLDQMAMAAQSARLDAISGATYTVDAYKVSLQSALDKVR